MSAKHFISFFFLPQKNRAQKEDWFTLKKTFARLKEKRRRNSSSNELTRCRPHRPRLNLFQKVRKIFTSKVRTISSKAQNITITANSPNTIAWSQTPWASWPKSASPWQAGSNRGQLHFPSTPTSSSKLTWLPSCGPAWQQPPLPPTTLRTCP